MFLNWLLDHYRDYIVRKLGFELLSTIHVYFLIVVFARSIAEVIFFNRKSYRNFKTSLANAILASSNANRMPRQERGPEPNGIQAIGCLLFFNSGSNLDNNPRRLRWLCTSICKKSALKITDRDRSGKDPATKRDRDVFAIREFGHLFQPECDIDPVGHLQPPRE